MGLEKQLSGITIGSGTERINIGRCPGLVYLRPCLRDWQASDSIHPLNSRTIDMQPLSILSPVLPDKFILDMDFLDTPFSRPVIDDVSKA